MARIKTKIVYINELKCKEHIISEIKSIIDTGEYDFNNMTILLKSKSPPPFIADVDKAIKSLERYYLCNKPLITTLNSEQIVRRKQLARMLGISRPTLNRWIHYGFIHPIPLKCLQGETFPVHNVLQQLISYKIKSSKKDLSV